MNFTLPQWYDLHVHFRQGKPMADYIKAHLDMGCCGVLAMPNTKPPVSKVSGSNGDNFWTIETYLEIIKAAGGDQFQDIIVPLYLTKDTTPAMITEGAKSGVLRACKYYPPHGTTNSEFGAAIENYLENGVFAAMEEAGIVLNIHGEEHGLSGEKYFGQDSNAEDFFYRERVPKITEKFPKLKIVCEHITTKTAADFVTKADDNIAATITPQHLLYTVADLLQGLKYHLYCLPLVKFKKDKNALLSAATSKNNSKFFAGTDSAPHTKKATECGCAAGCFTGGIAPQLYARAFDLDENNFDVFKNFLCLNGPKFYGLPEAKGTFTLEKKPSKIVPTKTDEGDVMPLSLGLGQDTLEWTIAP
ncbi:MAG TPA: amidohydrolase family protein [Alphaproteobacteria bacterium]|nr:amidohydrolase family protein [Alphaproteobacteria bacterium]